MISNEPENKNVEQKDAEAWYTFDPFDDKGIITDFIGKHLEDFVGYDPYGSDHGSDYDRACDEMEEYVNKLSDDEIKELAAKILTEEEYLYCEGGKIIDDREIEKGIATMAKYYTDEGKPVYSMTLLTADEYKQNRDHIAALDSEDGGSCRWWLREEKPHKGYGTLLVDENTNHYIDADGTVKRKTEDMPTNGEIFPDSVYCVCNIRPVLHMEDLTVGEQVSFGDKCFTAISNNLALCDESIGISTYSHEKDNDYEHSEVKAFIENWLERTREIEEEMEEGLS